MLNSAELMGIRTAQLESFWDTCVILVRSAVSDSYGQPIDTPVEGEPTPCRLYPRGSQELRQMEQRLVSTDAVLRLPLGTTIGSGDTVRITHRYGEALSASEIFEVASDPAPMRGPTAITVELRKVKR